MSVVLVTVVVSVRLMSATFRHSQTSWETSLETLTEAAEFARTETKSLRARVAELEDNARVFAAERAAWFLERSELVARVAELETSVERLSRELAAVSGPPKGEKR